jgi:RNA polymerase sigma-70 factor (ECF subfamily)
MNDSELSLVERLKRREEEAFQELVETYKQRVFFIALRIVRDEDQASDVAQEVFVKVYKSIEKFQGRSSLYTWIYRIAVNLAINRSKRDRFKRMVSLSELPRPRSSKTPNPLEELEEKELRERIDQAIRALPEKQKAVFILKYFENMTHQEIARIMDCSEGTAKANYFHAIRKLRKRLGGEFA